MGGISTTLADDELSQISYPVAAMKLHVCSQMGSQANSGARRIFAIYCSRAFP